MKEKKLKEIEKSASKAPELDNKKTGTKWFYLEWFCMFMTLLAFALPFIIWGFEWPDAQRGRISAVLILGVSFLSLSYYFEYKKIAVTSSEAIARKKVSEEVIRAISIGTGVALLRRLF